MSFLLKPNDKSINSSTTWEFGEAFLNSAFRALLCFENETSSSPIIIIYTIINLMCNRYNIYNNHVTMFGKGDTCVFEITSNTHLARDGMSY